MELYRKRERDRESERGRKLAPVDISSFLIILFHVAEQDSLDMGVMVIMGICNSFLQSSCCYYITWIKRCFFFPTISFWVADRSDFDLVQFVLYLPIWGSFLCTSGYIKSLPVFACIPRDVFALACVCLAWHPWVGWEFQGLTGWGGGLWHSDLISLEALCAPETWAAAS